METVIAGGRRGRRRVGGGARVRVAVAGVVGLAASVLVGPLTAAPAAAASDLGGPIGPTEIVRRAAAWQVSPPKAFDCTPPGIYPEPLSCAYGPGDDTSGAQAGYRLNPVGFAAMAWHLDPGNGPLDFDQLRGGFTKAIPLGDLMPGDVVMDRFRNQVMIFDRWTGFENGIGFEASLYLLDGHTVKRSVVRIVDKKRNLLNGFEARRYVKWSSDLWFIKTRNTASGKVEVHSATRQSRFRDRGVSSTTRFAAAEADNGTWAMVGADLWFIKTRNTASGKVELHTAKAPSYRSGKSFVTRFSTATAADGIWQMDGDDLWFIKTRNTASGKVEASSATAATGYSFGLGRSLLDVLINRGRSEMTYQTVFPTAEAPGTMFQIVDNTLWSIRIPEWDLYVSVHGANSSITRQDPALLEEFRVSPMLGMSLEFTERVVCFLERGWVNGKNLVFISPSERGRVEAGDFEGSLTPFSASDWPNGVWTIAR